MLKTSIYNLFLNINKYIIIWFVILTFGFDFLDKIGIFYNIDYIKFNRYLKIIVGFYALIFILFHFSYLIDKLKYVIYTICALALIFALKNNYWILYYEEYVRYNFILALYPMLHYSFCKKKLNELFMKFYTILKVFTIINLCAIVIGFFFNVLIFQTYQFERFGYNGILLSQGLTPYVYMTSIAFFWANKNRRLLVLVIISSIFSGVKGVYFGEFVLFVLLLILDNKYSKTTKIKLITICFVVFSLLLAIIFSTRLFRDVINNDGILAAIFSYRIDNLINLIRHSSENFNILIGATGLPFVRLELQIIDIILLFGVFGVLVYIYFLFSLFNDIVNNKIAIAFFTATLLLSFLSGNLLYIPLAATLFVVTLLYLNRNIAHDNFNNI